MDAKANGKVIIFWIAFWETFLVVCLLARAIDLASYDPPRVVIMTIYGVIYGTVGIVMGTVIGYTIYSAAQGRIFWVDNGVITGLIVGLLRGLIGEMLFQNYQYFSRK